MLCGMPFQIRSLKEENIDIDVIEDGTTFEENSKKKASEIVEFLKNKGEKSFIVLSDDSGLEVDYLNGEPVYILLDIQENMAMIEKIILSY